MNLPAIEIPMTKTYFKNYNGCSDAGEPCVVCGKEVRSDSKTAHYIRLGRGGTHAVTNEEADANLASDLGVQPIGPDCWRRHPQLHPFENGAGGKSDG